MLCHGVGPLGGVSKQTNLPISMVYWENNRPRKPLLALAILIFISHKFTEGRQFAASN